MNRIQNLEIHIIKKTIKVCFIVLLILVVLKKAAFINVFGLLYGTVISLLNFLQLSLTMKKAVKMDVFSAKKYAFYRYTLRYVLTLILLIIPLKTPLLNFYAACLGVFIIKMVIFAEVIFTKKPFTSRG